MKVNREQFLKEVESVLPGLSEREIIEQSNAIVFKNGRIYTYNDEVSCRCPTALTGVTGVVKASGLLATLRKMIEEEIDVKIVKAEMLIKGKRRKAYLPIDAEVLLPISDVEKPKEWKRLPKQFSKAIELVRQSVGIDASKFALTCVHIHPDHIEATDGSQGSRFVLETPIKKSILLRGDSVRTLSLGSCRKFSETKNWVHFKTAGKGTDCLIISCRRYKDKFPDLGKILNFKGAKMVLPKLIDDSVEFADIFSSSSDAGENNITVTLTENKVLIEGSGLLGRSVEPVKVKYEGPDLAFQIAPQLFVALAKKHPKCVVSQSRIKVKVDSFSFVAALELVKEEEE